MLSQRPLPGDAVFAACALAAVLLLIVCTARLARRYTALRGSSRPGALARQETVCLDARRRLHLVQAGPHRALVLTGGPSDTLVLLPDLPP